MTKELSFLEFAVLEKQLEGNHPVLNVLRNQLATAKVGTRDLTGAGFFTEIILPPNIPRALLRASEIKFGDVEASIPGLEFGAGFLLYIRDGRMSLLEGYSFEEEWPKSIASFELKYSDPNRKQFWQALAEV